MKRIKFDHTQNDVLKAIGLDSPKEADKITMDEDHPDCYKMRLAAAILNGTPFSVLSILTMLMVGNSKLEPRVSPNFELLFNNLDNEVLKRADKAIQMFNESQSGLSAEEMKELITEELAKSVEELAEERKAEADEDGRNA